MTKSLMIEIDEATKDIMTELQSGLTRNIETGISNSLHTVMQRQEGNIKEIEQILSLQLSTVTADIEATKKPITRMARDIEQSIKLMTDVKLLQKEQSEQFAQVGQQQLNSIHRLMEEMLSELAKTQEVELAKSIQAFDSQANDVKLKFAEEIQQVQKSFSTIVAETEQSLQQQYNDFVQLNNQLADNGQQLQSETNLLKQTIADQEAQFEKMTSHFTQQFTNFNEALQNSFHEHTTALTKQREQHVTEITSDVKQQVAAMEQVVAALITSNEQAIQQLNGQITASITAMEQQILNTIVNNKAIEALQQQVSSLETTITNIVKEQAVVEKLATIEQDLAYARLPFYKKWFTKREDF